MKNYLITLTLAAGILISPISNTNIRADEPKLEQAAPPTNLPDFNTILKTNTIELTNWIKSTAQKTGDFAAEQTPLFLKEYVAWEIWSNIFKCLLLIVFPLVLIPAAIFFFKRIKGWRSDDADLSWGRANLEKYPDKQSDHNNIIFVICAVLGFISSLICICNIFEPASTAIKGMIAPRVLIVEKISSLVK